MLSQINEVCYKPDMGLVILRGIREIFNLEDLAGFGSCQERPGQSNEEERFSDMLILQVSAAIWQCFSRPELILRPWAQDPAPLH